MSSLINILQNDLKCSQCAQELKKGDLVLGERCLSCWGNKMQYDGFVVTARKKGGEIKQFGIQDDGRLFPLPPLPQNTRWEGGSFRKLPWGEGGECFEKKIAERGMTTGYAQFNAYPSNLRLPTHTRYYLPGIQIRRKNDEEENSNTRR